MCRNPYEGEGYVACGEGVEGEKISLYQRVSRERIFTGLRADRESVEIRKLLTGGLWDNDCIHERISTSSAVKIEEEL